MRLAVSQCRSRCSPAASARARRRRQRETEFGARCAVPGTGGSKSSAPPCCSITVRHRLRPRPMPSLRVVKKGVNSRARHLGRDARPGVGDVERDPARVRLAHARCAARAARPGRCCLHRLDARCAPGSAAPARPWCGRTRTRGARLRQVDARCACRSCAPAAAPAAAPRRSAGRHADRLALLLAPAHEVVHALDDAAGALGLLGDALQRLAQHAAGGVGIGLAPSGSASRWRSWRSPPAAGSARGSAARPSRRRWPAAPWPAAAPAAGATAPRRGAAR